MRQKLLSGSQIHKALWGHEWSSWNKTSSSTSSSIPSRPLYLFSTRDCYRLICCYIEVVRLSDVHLSSSATLFERPNQPFFVRLWLNYMKILIPLNLEVSYHHSYLTFPVLWINDLRFAFSFGLRWYSSIVCYFDSCVEGFGLGIEWDCRCRSWACRDRCRLAGGRWWKGQWRHRRSRVCWLS